MSNTENQNFSSPPAGQADWDTDLRANITIGDRGYHAKFTAGQGFSSGDAFCVQSGFAFIYNAASLDSPKPTGISYIACNSGDEIPFLLNGIVSSLGGVWSGTIVPGRPVFTNPASPGFLVSSYSAARHSIGLALRADQIFINPGRYDTIPEFISETTSFALVVGSDYDFSMNVGNRGVVRQLETNVDSVNAYKIKFWSGSAKVSSELLYETLTTSVDGGAGDFDIKSLSFRDAALFPYRGTDTSSYGLIFGRISPQSSSTVGSSNMSVSVFVERFN